MRRIVINNVGVELYDLYYELGSLKSPGDKWKFARKALLQYADEAQKFLEEARKEAEDEKKRGEELANANKKKR